MTRLEIYIERSCLACRRSLHLAEHVRQRFPDVEVQVIDIATGEGGHQHLVVATPTFVLNGKLLSLGNPSRAQLEKAITGLPDGGR